ncbi:MFS transporter [Streptomyces nogalater]
MIGETFDGRARGRAFGAVGITTGAGLALGAMAAGAVTDTLGWRAFFGLHAVLMALVWCTVPLLPRGDAGDRAVRGRRTARTGHTGAPARPGSTGPVPPPSPAGCSF